MLVEVVRLREDGVKLTREQIRAARAIRAEFWMFRMNGVVRASYGPPGGSCSYFLEPAAIVSMRGTDFLVVGLERVGKMWEERQVPQAWWCRLAGGSMSADLGTPEVAKRTAAVAEALA